jgi:hypothetical protein
MQKVGQLYNKIMMAVTIMIIYLFIDLLSSTTIVQLESAGNTHNSGNETTRKKHEFTGLRIFFQLRTSYRLDFASEKKM